MMASSGYFNMPKSLELALNNGVNPLTGTQLGPQTGRLDELTTFDKFLEAVHKQMAHGLRLKMTYDGIARQAYAEFCPVPFTSLLMDDCLRTGKDYHDGGTHYTLPMVCGVGTGTMADSLAAVKKFIYEDKTILLKELVDALHSDFKGHERLLQMLRNRAP